MQFDPTQPMALMPDAVSHVIELAKGVAQVVKPPEAYILDAMGNVTESQTSQGLIAVVPLWGVLTPDGGWRGTSLDDFARLVRQLDNNSNVETIVLNIRSPGGTVSGTPEAAAAVRAVRDGGRTKIISVANVMMASAATWIGAAASEVVVTPSGEAGSIGVISMYADWSKAYEGVGIKVDVMRVPAKKARFTGLEPMTPEMRQHIEDRINQSYELFKRAMADNRGIRIDQVEKKFGGGEMMSSTEAVDAGLVDRIGTLEQVLAGLVKTKAPASKRAELAKAML